MANCVMCGSPLPDNQGSRTCSMCYGDMDHGKDGYYRREMEREEMEREAEREHERRQEAREQERYEEQQ